MVKLMKDSEFDPKGDGVWFFHSHDDWVIIDEEGQPYLRCWFAGKVFRLYLVADGTAPLDAAEDV
jgi:hypothetical protein